MSDPMSSSPIPDATADSNFVCNCPKTQRSACDGEPFYKEYEGNRYCVLHFPGEEKSASFNESLKRKLALLDLDFRGVWFPDGFSFRKFRFKSDVNFSYAVFNTEADFSSARFDLEADFRYAKFNAKVNFNSAIFNAGADFRDTSFAAKADFSSVTFSHSHTYFTRANFCAEAFFNSTFFGTRTFFTNAVFNARADFTFASFNERAYFMKTTIKAWAYFTYTSFESYVLFSGSEDKHEFNDETWLDFQFARIEKPERVSFHTLTLRPHWFVNTDTRKLDFINVDWDWRAITVSQEVESLKRKKILSPHRLLAIVYRHLAFNAEENHRYDEASRFRYMAMDARRLASWRGFTPWQLSWWYWMASGYGERILRALIVFIAIWLGFATLYRLPSPIRCPDDNRQDCIRWVTTDDKQTFFDSFFNSAVYTIEVMTLQKPEPRPKSPPARLAVTLCTILGPLQAALLALAIRRKFMR